jgi:hypothetical protein
MSDEDEPWCVFADEETGEEVAHVCRTSAGYVCASRFAVGVMREPVLSELVDRLIGGLPTHQGCGAGAARASEALPTAMERGLCAGRPLPTPTRRS